MSHDIDLVINTFNNADVLALTLGCLELQRTPADLRWSVVVVDNNCTDHTADVVQGYIERGKIPSLRRVCEPRQGIGYARRCGVMATDAPLIGFIDDDCLVAEDWVAEAVAFSREKPEAGVFGGKVKLKLEEPSELVDVHGAMLAAMDHGEEAVRVDNSQELWLVGAGMCVRREGLRRAGWFEHLTVLSRYGRHHLRGGSDTEIIVRVVRAGYESWYTPRMRLEHLMPAWRTAANYLTRLSYAQGRQAPLLLEAEHGKRWPRGQAMREMYRNGKRAIRGWVKSRRLRMGGKDFEADDARIRAARHRGMTMGWMAIAMGMRPGERFDAQPSDGAAAEAIYSKTDESSAGTTMSDRGDERVAAPAAK